MSFNPYYYENIVVTNPDISINDISSDYLPLKNYDIYGSIFKKPDLLTEFDISFISLIPNSSNVLAMNLNMRDISNINNVIIDGIEVKNVKIDFFRDISFTNLQFIDFNNIPLNFNLYTTDGINYYQVDSNVSTIDIKTSDLSSNTIIVNFANSTQLPTFLNFERYKTDNIFLIGYNYIQPNSIIQEKIEENFNWIQAPWKDISINNTDITDGSGLDISGLNYKLYNTKNIQGRRIFTNTPIQISNLGYPYFTMNFYYQGYTDADNITNDISIVDISTALIRINDDLSLNNYLSKNIYLNINSNLFTYLDITSENVNLSTNINSENAIKLPINTDVSFNFLFKQYNNINTQISYNNSEISSNYVNFSTINNISDKLPIKDESYNVINYTSKDISASYFIITSNIPIIKYLDKSVLYQSKYGRIIDIDSTIVSKIDCSNISVFNLNINSNYSNKIFDSSRVNVNNIDISNVYFYDSNTITSVQNSILKDCDISNGKIISSITDVNDISSSKIYIFKSLNMDSASSINNISDFSYIHLITYNNSNLIDFDSCANMLSFGVSAESIMPVNLDISGTLNSFPLVGTGAISNLSSRIITKYRADINTADVNNIYITSDDRYKHNETDISNAINIIKLIKPKKYIKTKQLYDASHNFNIIPNDAKIDSGYIAQEIYNITDLSHVVNSHNNINSINYSAIQPYLVKSLQELYSIINQQTITISNLQKEIELLENNS